MALPVTGHPAPGRWPIPAGLPGAAAALAVLLSLAPGARASVQVGSMAPEFTLQDISGRSYTLSAYRGKAVLLAFIGHSCVRCRAAGPAVERVWQDFKDSRVFQAVALDVWDGSVSEVQDFIQVTGATFPVLRLAGYLQLDDESAYGLHNDNYVVVDAGGIVRYTSDNGPYLVTRFDDTLVRATIRDYLPTAVTPAAWTAIKALYR